MSITLPNVFSRQVPSMGQTHVNQNQKDADWLKPESWLPDSFNQEMLPHLFHVILREQPQLAHEQLDGFQRHNAIPNVNDAAGTLDKIALFLSKGSSVGQKNSNGLPLSSRLIKQGFPSLLNVLMQKGWIQVNPMLTDRYGYSTLAYAALHGFPDLTKTLITQLPEGLLTVEGGAELIEFARKQQDNIRLLKSLMPEEREAWYHKTWEELLFQNNITEKEAAYRFIALGAAGLNVDTPGALLNSTALHYAAFGNYAEVSRAFLMLGTDASIRNQAGHTPLYEAVDNAALEVLSALLMSDAEINQLNVNGETALHRAALKSIAEVVSTLLDAGATVNARNEFGQTPLHIAVASGNMSTAQALLNAKDINLEERNNAGQTALHVAADKGQTRLVKALLQKGAQVDTRDFLKRTPLHLAAGVVDQEERPELVTHLLRAGAGVNDVDMYQYTPLHYAASMGHYDVVCRLLREPGIQVNAETNQQQTALDLATQRRVRILLQYYAE